MPECEETPLDPGILKIFSADRKLHNDILRLRSNTWAHEYHRRVEAAGMGYDNLTVLVEAVRAATTEGSIDTYYLPGGRSLSPSEIDPVTKVTNIEVSVCIRQAPWTWRRATAEDIADHCHHPDCPTLDAAQASLSKCGRCTVARYCGLKCQKAHWKSGHSIECSTMKTFCSATQIVPCDK